MGEEKTCPFKAFFEAHAPALLPHRGKIGGMLVGALLGLAVLFCCFVGLLVGIRIDHGIRLRDVEDFFDETFPYRWRNRQRRFK